MKCKCGRDTKRKNAVEEDNVITPFNVCFFCKSVYCSFTSKFKGRYELSQEGRGIIEL